MTNDDLHIRDPFVLPIPSEGRYYLFGTTDGKNAWSGPGHGFDCYVGTDLIHWEGPIPAFRAPNGFWADRNFWAAECHAYGGRYYLFASFKSENACRGTQILAADSPEGPFLPLTDSPVTPRDRECLDGTLYVEEDGAPWMVFCHEWLQIGNGSICALPLTADLSSAAGDPVLLFHASDAPWSHAFARDGRECRVTDGPWLHRTVDGTLLMLWSGTGEGGYTTGIARSVSGRITGPWVQEPEPLFRTDGGHAMLFRTKAGSWSRCTPRTRPAWNAPSSSRSAKPVTA